MSDKFPNLNTMSVAELMQLANLTMDSKDKSDMEFTEEIKKELLRRAGYNV